MYDSDKILNRPRAIWLSLAFLFFSFLSTSPERAAAMEEARDAGDSAQVEALPSEAFDRSNWFFYMSAGFGKPAYDEEVQARIESQKQLGLESPQAGVFDFPGVYRKIQPGLAVGATLHFTVENYARKWRDPESFAIQTYSPAASVLYFTGGKMGEGWFAKGDLGPSRFYQRLRALSAPNEYGVITSHRDGVFAQVGAGYGWEASHFARVLVHINALIVSAGPNSLKGATLNIGFLL